jgi:HD-GYP domain-containing protein (c-di-GMP phosphodiesterase class II)
MKPLQQANLASLDLATVRRWTQSMRDVGGIEVSVFRWFDSGKWQVIAPSDPLPSRISECLTILEEASDYKGDPDSTKLFQLKALESNLLGARRLFIGSLPINGCVYICDASETNEFSQDLFARLAATSWNYEACREELQKQKSQQKEFVKQVTKDFEELTWLRSVALQLGNATFKHSIDELVSVQLPKLRQVIEAEFIGLVPIEAVLHPSPENQSRISSSGTLAFQIDQLVTFVNRCNTHAYGLTSVFNKQSSVGIFDGFPEFRNCIFTKLEKNGKVYGYLIALNKEVDSFCESPEQFLMIDPNGFQFGTFEAGLLASLGTVLSSHAANSELFREQEQLVTGVIRAIINAIDAKDQYTCGHSDRVAAFSKAIAQQMGLDAEQCERIYLTGLLHDVGKIGIPDSILSKPDKLTYEEYEVIKKHPEIGCHILQHLKPIEYVLPGVMHHHEAVNGKGYPHGLTGELIPLEGRIIAVADAYDAMTSDRPYRKGMPSEKAESILCQEAGKTWDELAVYAMMECISQGLVSPQGEAQPAIPEKTAFSSTSLHPL